jgi:hypothetical protein
VSGGGLASAPAGPGQAILGRVRCHVRCCGPVVQASRAAAKLPCQGAVPQGSEAQQQGMVLAPRRSRSPAHRPLDLGRAGRPVVAASLQALQRQAGELAEHLAVALGGLGRRFDEQSAPPPRVGDPADVPRPFQAIDDRRDASGPPRRGRGDRSRCSAPGAPQAPAPRVARSHDSTCWTLARPRWPTSASATTASCPRCMAAGDRQLAGGIRRSPACSPLATAWRRTHHDLRSARQRSPKRWPPPMMNPGRSASG